MTQWALATPLMEFAQLGTARIVPLQALRLRIEQQGIEEKLMSVPRATKPDRLFIFFSFYNRGSSKMQLSVQFFLRLTQLPQLNPYLSIEAQHF